MADIGSTYSCLLTARNGESCNERKPYCTAGHYGRHHPGLSPPAEIMKLLRDWKSQLLRSSIAQAVKGRTTTPPSVLDW